MHRYIVLLKFTGQGLKKIKKSTSRAREFKKLAGKAGVQVEGQYWSAGNFDGLLILASKHEEKILRLVAMLAALGNVRTESVRAFTGTEFETIVGK